MESVNDNAASMAGAASADTATVSAVQNAEVQLAEIQAQVQKMQDAGVKGDLTAMLQRIAALHQQNEQLKKDLQTRDSKIGQLQQKTQEEMMKKMETIVPWLDGFQGIDEETKNKFRCGLQDLIKLTAEDSGVWKVVCCASETHAQNVTKIEALQREANLLREKVSGGHFGGDANRIDSAALILGKRKSDVISADDVREGGHEEGTKLWDDFAVMIKQDNQIRV